MCVYASILCSSQEMKDQFCEDLESTIGRIPESELIFPLEDFNARVGSDHDTWPHYLGYFGLGNMNDNGQKLLKLSSY